MMSVEKIMFYASSKHGMSEPIEPSTLRLCARLVAEGHLRREEKRVMIPAIKNEEHARHATSLGLNPAEHEAVIIKYFAVK